MLSKNISFLRRTTNKKVNKTSLAALSNLYFCNKHERFTSRLTKNLLFCRATRLYLSWMSKLILFLFSLLLNEKKKKKIEREREKHQTVLWHAYFIERNKKHFTLHGTRFNRPERFSKCRLSVALLAFNLSLIQRCCPRGSTNVRRRIVSKFSADTVIRNIFYSCWHLVECLIARIECVCTLSNVSGYNYYISMYWCIPASRIFLSQNCNIISV